MQKKITVLNVNIDALTMEESVSVVEKFITDKIPKYVVTANAEIVMLAQRDQEFAGIIERADLVLPDGAGVVWAARYNGYVVPERVAGFDLVQQLMIQSAQKGHRIYMFGGAPGVVTKAKETAQSKYPGVNIVGTRHGYFTESENSEIIEDIRKCQPDILLIALGVPKQEQWVTKNLTTLGIPVSIGVGGTFDVMAGVMQRAPLWMQKANLEWLFRLMLQPKRIIRMMALPQFVCKVLAKK